MRCRAGRGAANLSEKQQDKDKVGTARLGAPFCATRRLISSSLAGGPRTARQLMEEGIDPSGLPGQAAGAVDEEDAGCLGPCAASPGTSVTVPRLITSVVALPEPPAGVVDEDEAGGRAAKRRDVSGSPKATNGTSGSVRRNLLCSLPAGTCDHKRFTTMRSSSNERVRAMALRWFRKPTDCRAAKSSLALHRAVVICRRHDALRRRRAMKCMAVTATRQRADKRWGPVVDEGLEEAGANTPVRARAAPGGMALMMGLSSTLSLHRKGRTSPCSMFQRSRFLIHEAQAASASFSSFLKTLRQHELQQ